MLEINDSNSGRLRQPHQIAGYPTLAAVPWEYRRCCTGNVRETQTLRRCLWRKIEVRRIARLVIVPLDIKTPTRRYARIALPKGMPVAWQHVGGRGVSRVAILGLGGLFIATPFPAPVGTLLKLVFDVPGGEVRARATVKNLKEGQGMGMAVALISMASEDRARLNQLVKKLA